VAEEFQNEGFTNVKALKGGLSAWQETAGVGTHMLA
jgi:hypothetical protein